MPLCDGSSFLLPCEQTPVPLKNPARSNEHILCQMFEPCKFLLFIGFLKIEYNKPPNFAVWFKKMEKNCPNLALRPILEIGLAGSRLDHKMPVGGKEAP